MQNPGQQSLATGFSLLKNLGLGDGPIDTSTAELKVRPKNAGLSEEIDGIKGETPILKPVGAWRINGPPMPPLNNPQIINSQNKFCESSTFPILQSALCAFHENIVQRKVISQSQQLIDKANLLQQKIKELKMRKKQMIQNIQAKNNLKDLIQSVKDDPMNYSNTFQLIFEIAKNPQLISSPMPKTYKYQKEQKNPFEVPRLTITVAESFSNNLIESGIFNTENVSEWMRLRNWMFDVQTAFSPNSAIDKLWVKFLEKTLFPKASVALLIESSDECTKWANLWLEKGLLSPSTLSIFFTNVAKPFLVDTLQFLCDNMKVHTWIELADAANLSSQFAVIVRLHADKVLINWQPPSPLAERMLRQWPNVLGRSLDFMYRTIGPKLATALTLGKIDVIKPWIGILPISLSASLIADHFIQPKILEMDSLISENLTLAAKFYVHFKSEIPEEVIGTPRIVSSLIDALNRLKSKSPILKGLTVEKEAEPASIGDLLENIAFRCGKNFAPKGTIEGKIAYEIGDKTFGVHGGVIYILNDKSWVPIFVKEIFALFS
ncbi:septin-interacting protein 1 isoform X1 [Histomonas meleagridis]|uniref:septin-interacting protein 1 isoform X1 n=1 Tax=Histomonas meleagridis TaxID=135588 RepID=UPI003559788F|nr:septin-interacting protein 1 isoform X1 [Histomonas meleagridis]KAH0802841.1 septin-interacting protein 1 isoform X1 [Histomonas meleagridis]